MTISGSVNSGLENTFTTVDPDMPGAEKVKNQDFLAYAHDADVEVIRADLNIDAEVTENFGVHVKFRYQPGGEDFKGRGFNVPYVPYAYGKTTAFNILDIYGGLVDNGEWATDGDKADDVGEGLGGLVQLRPIDGLNVGFGVYDNDSTIFLDAIFTYGLSFAKENLFRLAVSGKTDMQQMRAIFGSVSILAVPGLTAAVEAWSDTLSAKDMGWTIDEKISYQISDALEVGATFWQFINLPNFGVVEDIYGYFVKAGLSSALPDTSSDFKLGIKGNIWGAFTIGAFVPKLEIYGGTSGYDAGTGGDGKSFYLGAKPSITWNVAENAKIVGAYAFDWGQVKVDMSGTEMKPTATKHTVYVDFVYSF